MNQILNFFNKPLLKIPMAFGALAGAICFFYFLLMQNFDKISSTNRYLDIGFFLIFIATASWYYRKNVGNGYLHLWEGIGIGYTVWLTGCLVWGWLSYGLFSFWPNLLTNYQQKLTQFLVANKVAATKDWGKDGFDLALKNVSQITAESFIFDELRVTLLLMIFGVIVVALIFRKQETLL